MKYAVVFGAIVASSLFSTRDACAQSDFVNWETPHVHPLELSADGANLFAVNTPDDRLEVFDSGGTGLKFAFDVPVGLDPVSVRARTANEIWVVNQISDSVSIIDLKRKSVIATLSTDDEPADVVFAGSPQRAFVSCTQSNTVLVFDPANLAAAPARLDIDGQRPRALAASLDGSKVYVAIFDSGNRSTVIGGGTDPMIGNLAFPPNGVSDPLGPYGGINPPPNFGSTFNPPIDGALPPPPPVSLIVKKDANDHWLDDNAHDWTDMVSGPNAAHTGRPVGWDLVDHDVAVIDTATMQIGYVKNLMNVCMAISVEPVTGHVVVVGTDATNEVRFEPIVDGHFLRVLFAEITDDGSVSGTPASHVVDLNPHLDYTQTTIPQSERDESLGDPRGVAWTFDGARGFVTGMGSNCVVVVDATGQRIGSTATIPVGEGPTGIVVHDAKRRVYVLNKFESSISVLSVRGEKEIARIPFHDPSPTAIKVGRKHLYDTHKNSGLGHIACGSCHVDARNDELAWDLGNPAGAIKSTTGQNVGAGIPGLGVNVLPFHPMKGPMTTQTLQDIIGHEPLHWRGDREGLEAFNGAFIGLQGDDTNLTPTEMQEFEDFLATITIPPNPRRNFDNTLPASVPLPGHFTTGRFAPAGQPLPDGNPTHGLQLYRQPSLLDAGVFACATCHTLPTGMGTDMKKNSLFAPFTNIPLGPNGEHHHMLVTVDGATNRVVKVPQLRTEYAKVGFDLMHTTSRVGFGVLHDGSIDSLERFVAEPVFTVQNDQDVADLVALILCMSGSDLPLGSVNKTLEPPGPPSQDTPASVGKQVTVNDASTASASTIATVGAMLSLAQGGTVGLVVKGKDHSLARGWAFVASSGLFQSDRASETIAPAALFASAAPGSERTYTVVPKGSEIRIGVDRDRDGVFDRDELDQGTDPSDPASNASGCAKFSPAPPAKLVATVVSANEIDLLWFDQASNEDGFRVERAAEGTGQYQLLSLVPADQTTFVDSTVVCGESYDYRVSAYNCASGSGFAEVNAATPSCSPNSNSTSSSGSKRKKEVVRIPPRPPISH